MRIRRDARSCTPFSRPKLLAPDPGYFRGYWHAADDELAWLGTHFEKAAKLVEQRCCSLRRQDWAIIFPMASIQPRKLLNKLLAFDPTRRLVAHDALQHACLKDLYDAEDDSFGVKHWKWDDGWGDVPSLWKKDRRRNCSIPLVDL